ncbi:MAG: fasciclin domain-containing protein [Gammaproteobacteria bacterium]|jgi:uncharacterized surface protein with fasciclin (FAS1) repeats
MRNIRSKYFPRRFVSSLAIAVLALTATVPALAGDNDSQKRDIITTAREAGQFTTLIAALDAAGLSYTLSNGGPYTVFAPTDAAFAELPPGTVEYLLQPENRDVLIAVLKHHVVNGWADAREVRSMSSAKTLHGEKMRIRSGGNNVMLDNAYITSANIKASNGIIHVVDKVIVPNKVTACGSGPF